MRRTINELPETSIKLHFALAPDGNHLIYTSGTEVRQMDLSKADSKALYEQPAGINCLATSRDGKLIATGDSEGSVRVWDLASSKEVKSARVRGGVFNLTFFPDGKTLAVAGGDLSIENSGGVWLFDLGEKKLPRVLQGFRYAAMLVAVSPDGKTLVTEAGDDEAVAWAGINIWLWDVAKQKVRTKWKAGGGDLAFSNDGRYIIVDTSKGSFPDFKIRNPGSVGFFDVGTGKEVFRLTAPGDIRGLALSPDGKLLAVSDAGPPRKAEVWDISRTLSSLKPSPAK